MSCVEMDRLLDANRVAELSRAEKASVEDHLRDCTRCAAVWQTHDWLAAEAPAQPPPGAFERMLGVLDGSARAAVPRRRLRGLRRVAGPLGLAATVLLGVAFFWQPGTSTPPGADMPAGAGQRSLGRADDPSSALAPTAARRFVEGEHYTRVAGATAAPAAAESISVEFFFMYGCGHCYAFEKIFEPWRASQPASIRISHVPVMFNPVARLHARAFYAAELLGLGADMHRALFRAIHERGLPMATEVELAGLAMTFGVDPDEYLRVLSSDPVLERVARAEAKNRAYGISATPMLIVAASYRVLPGTAGSYEDMLAVADQLIDDSGDFCRAGSRREPADRCAGRDRVR